MLRNRNILVGKYYVNNARKIAREVLAADDQIITFYTHHLDTGNSCPSPSQCMKRDFIHWADHEATSAEIAGLQYRLVEAAVHEPQWPGGLQPAPTSSRGETTTLQRRPS